MTAPRTSTILTKYNELSDDIKDYFNHFPRLARDFPWDISISYMFSLIELAHNRTIYCGAVKCHRVNSELASTAVENHHMSRNEFRALYKSIFGKPLERTAADKIGNAEKVRDLILHGKNVSENDKRQAVADVLDYAEAFNAAVNDIAGFKPFGSLRGFKGRAQSLNKSTSRWILKGIGLTVG